MSNKTRKPKPKSPPARISDVSKCYQQLFGVNQGVVQNSNQINILYREVYDWQQYVFKQGIVKEEEFREFQKSQDEKRKIAAEINKDKELSKEQRIEKAKEANIPESWVKG